MNFSVIQRISGGFALLVLLLLVMSVSSFRGLSDVDQQLQRTSQVIAPIILRSADMAVALLSANKSMMQFMQERTSKALKKQADDFSVQQQIYSQQRELLSGLAHQYPQVNESIGMLEEDTSAYFSQTQLAFKSHRTFLSLSESVVLLEKSLGEELDFFNNDIEDLIQYGETDAEKSAGSVFAANLKSISNDLNAVLNTDDLDKIKILKNSFDTVGYGLKGIEERLQLLLKGGSSNAEQLMETVVILQKALTKPNGVVSQHEQKVLMRKQTIASLLFLSKTIDAANETLSALRLEAQKLAQTSKQEGMVSVTTSQNTNIVISVVSVLVSILVAIWVSRSIRLPLNRVLSILKVIANGDLSQRVNVSSKDEFGQLSDLVNELADKQEKVIRDIQASSNNISNSAKDAADIGNHTKSMMGEQQQLTTQVATAIYQMSQTVLEVAQSAETAKYKVESIDQTANKNRLLMEENIALASSLASEIDRASAVIEELNEDSISIGNILEVIEGIAAQTNLLALNAAIEAARAGDTGRGFAVVADEVRTLASRTQNSTQEIQAMISKLQNGTKKAVSIMKSSRLEAQSSVSQAENAGSSLVEMVQELSEVRDMSSNIAAAAEQQTAASQDISDSVQRIAAMAEKGSDNAEKSASGSEALSSLAQEQQQELNHQFTLSAR
jgi:methyl-accepting chemotaxis protein